MTDPGQTLGLTVHLGRLLRWARIALYDAVHRSRQSRSLDNGRARLPPSRASHTFHPSSSTLHLRPPHIPSHGSAVTLTQNLTAALVRPADNATLTAV